MRQKFAVCVWRNCRTQTANFFLKENFLVTLQDFSPPTAAHPLMGELQTWQPQLTQNLCELPQAVRSQEESGSEELLFLNKKGARRANAKHSLVLLLFLYYAPVWMMKTFRVFRRIARSVIQERLSI